MDMETLIEEKVDIAPELLEQINTQEEKQVILHGIVKGFPNMDGNVRVWPTTYLIPKGSNMKCKIVHYFNIAMHPQYYFIRSNETLRFTLIFEGLPADCTSFDLVEIISEPYAFEVRDIQRNEEDVYTVYL
jgi:hypothetical protein